MLAHCFDRFYVVTKFILPTVNYLKFQHSISIVIVNDKEDDEEARQHILDLVTYCRKIDCMYIFINYK